jgi:hypothetical protein
MLKFWKTAKTPWSYSIFARMQMWKGGKSKVWLFCISANALRWNRGSYCYSGVDLSPSFQLTKYNLKLLDLRSVRLPYTECTLYTENIVRLYEKNLLSKIFSRKSCYINELTFNGISHHLIVLIFELLHVKVRKWDRNRRRESLPFTK